MTAMNRQNFRNLVSDVRFTPRGLSVKATGHDVPMTIGTLVDTWRWVEFDRALRKAPSVGREQIKVCFTPMEARPWYFARAIVDLYGAEVVDRPEDADIVWSFDDATYTDEIDVSGKLMTVNALCNDVSKTTVSRVSGEVFGTDLAVDPRTFSGLMVEKSEINGAHDGRKVQGPIEPKEGFVYQRLIDNEIPGGMVEDLRTTIMGGRPVMVFRKRRPIDQRFANANQDVILTSLEDVFSAQDIRQITRYAREIGLDAGGLDVLRDRHTGQLFVVDANKTDMGPPMALPLADKLRATRMMAEALERVIDEARSMRRVEPFAAAMSLGGGLEAAL
ncbi:MAG: hypothetical protein AAGH41_02910 [Pseudomonadota bacterium]